MSAPPVTPEPSSDADEAIPLLTEVIEVSRSLPGETATSLVAVDWSALERRVRDSVLDRLMVRSDSLLDDHLDIALRQVIGRAVDQLSTELRDALGRLVRELVVQAVAEELDEVRSRISSDGTE